MLFFYGFALVRFSRNKFYFALVLTRFSIRWSERYLLVTYMKKNNKYRNNNNNQIFSLNYKFDSSSIAGKFSGTALDLIKRYNELAKDSQSNGDYVNAEVFRQYAEHYRKIVTEINERKNQMRPKTDENGLAVSSSSSDPEGNTMTSENAPLPQDNAQSGEKKIAEKEDLSDNNMQETKGASAPTVKKEFKIIEISSANAGIVETKPEAKKMTKTRTRKKVQEAASV